MTILRTIKEQGVIGKIFFPNVSKPRPAVIILSGSNGGINELAAELFAENGYVALALAYFRFDGVPKVLENISLEYFLNAIKWLKSQPQVQPNKIHLYGASIGGELVLLLGSTFPNEIASIVAVAPSCVIYGGVPNANKPSYTYEGKALPIAPFPKEEAVLKQLETRQSISYTPLYLDVMKQEPQAFNKAMIKVENIKCPILLISGKDDKMRPACKFSELIMQRLNQFKSTIPRTNLCYENVGHMITNPCFPTTTGTIQVPYDYCLHNITNQNDAKFFQNPSSDLFCEIGGEPEAQTKACKDSWQKILIFFHNIVSNIIN